MADFLEEVKEDIKKERVEKLVAKYGRYFVAAGIFAIIGITIFSWYKDHVRNTQIETGDKYTEALRLLSGDKEKGSSLLNEIVDKGPASYREFARLKKAEILLEDGKVKEAVEVYDSIAVDASADLVMREVAGLQAAYILIEHSPEDNSIETRLDKLSKKGTIWYGSATELKALYLAKKDMTDQAADIFSQLSAADGLSSSMKERAEKMAALLKGNK